MGEAFLVRKGGGGKQSIAPTITEVSTAVGEITFTITNNDEATAVILYELGDTTPDANSIELAAGATSGNLTISGLTSSPVTIYAVSVVAEKTTSLLAEQAFTFTPLVYTAATGGTTVDYNVDVTGGQKTYRSHVFTSNGDFVVTQVGNVSGLELADYLIVAGGGYGRSTGGGGAGGFRTTIGVSGGNSLPENKVTLTTQTYPVVVGAGGTTSSKGGDSSAFSITSLGGGTAAVTTPGTHGSGAGRDAGGTSTIYAGTPGQGHDGGMNVNSAGAGGGGAGALGGNGGGTTYGGGGGAGLATLLLPDTANYGQLFEEQRWFAGGGGGGTYSTGWGGGGGRGGGGRGGGNYTSDTTAGGANTGGGGGGGRGGSKPGGSGIVIVRYEIAST